MLKALLRCAGCAQSDVKTPVSSIPTPQDACDDNDRAGLSRPSERPDQAANRSWAPDASAGAAGQAPDRLQGRQADEPGLSCAGGLGGRKSIDTARQAANAEEAAHGVVTAEGGAANHHVYSPNADSSSLSSELQEQQQQQATLSQDGQQQPALQQQQQQQQSALQDRQQQLQGAQQQQQQQLLVQPADPQQQHQHHTQPHQPVQAEPGATDAASAAAAADKHSGDAAGRGSHHHSDRATAAGAAAVAVAGAAAAAGVAAGCNGGSGTTSTTASSRRHSSHHTSSQPAAAGAAAAAGAGAAGAAAAGAVRGPEPSRTPRDEDLGCCPPYAAKAVWGLRYTMEDKWAAVPSLVMVPAVLTVSHKKSSSLFSKAAGSCGCMMKPSKTRSTGHSSSRHSSSSAAAGSSGGGSPSTSTNHNSESEQARLVQHHGSDETELQDVVPPGMTPALQQLAQGEYDALHYFGVFDGHGGADAAKHCAQFMHQVVADNIRRALDPDAAASGQQQGEGSTNGDAVAELQNDSQNNSAASNTAAAAAATAAVGSSSSDSQQESAPAAAAAAAASPQQPRGTPSLAQLLATNGSWLLPVLSRSFVSLDTHFGKISEGSYVGSTAVVVLLGATRLWVAHCGDSRAVLGRRGTAVVLTSDHKASRGDEVARVQAAGGHVWWDRVMGELAVSRAIGDHCLRPYVIPEPEVQMVDRSRDDELLVMASDGLWDVMNNQEAADMALHSLQAAEAGGHVGVAAAKRAAAALTKAALDRGTRDNVTVLVVDLRHRSASGASSASSNTPSGGVPVAGGVAAAPATSHHRHSSRSHRSSRSAAAAAAASAAASTAPSSSSSSSKAAGEQLGAAPAVVPAVAPAVAPAAAVAKAVDADADAAQALLPPPAAADALL